MSMSKFVLIGGGENGREGTEYETEEIDKEIIKLTNKVNNINFLFLAHGNNYEDSYYEIMRKIYIEKFNCNCDILTKKEVQEKEISQKKIEWADIVYVGGGNTLNMMKLWSESGFDQILRSFLQEEKVFCGISAGGICWCKYGISDSKKNNEDDEYIIVKGLDIFNILFCPSYDERIKSEENLERLMKDVKMPMIALEKGTAIVINNGEYKIIQSIKNKKVYKSFYIKENKYKLEVPIGDYKLFKELIQTNEEIN